MKFEQFFQAMADETRQKILLLLQKRNHCVGELVGQFNLSQPTISKHLLVLKNVGLVKDERNGQKVIYSLNKELLSECCSEYFKKFHCCNSLFTPAPDDKVLHK